jgi:ribonuclease-3
LPVGQGPGGRRGAASYADATARLEAHLGRAFADPGLLTQALSHGSWCAEAGGPPSNERLEFLGDAVLSLVVAEHCFRTFPDLSEGALSKVRAAVVNTHVLAEVAGELGVGEAVRLGRGEDASGGRHRPAILADAVEAVIGAVYLDGGWDEAARLVLGLLAERIAEAAAGPGAEDFKSRLQELATRRFGEPPRYEVEGTGPDHARHYAAAVYVSGELHGRGEGRSKKDAEQAAARAAWSDLADLEEGAGDAPGHEARTAEGAGRA